MEYTAESLPSIKFNGYDVPIRLFFETYTPTDNEIQRFNRGRDCYCEGRGCPDNPPGENVEPFCAHCIFCCNVGDRDDKCNAFADWLRTQGIASQREGFLRNLEGNFAMTDVQMVGE